MGAPPPYCAYMHACMHACMHDQFCASRKKGLEFDVANYVFPLAVSDSAPHQHICIINDSLQTINHCTIRGWRPYHIYIYIYIY